MTTFTVSLASLELLEDRVRSLHAINWLLACAHEQGDSLAPIASGTYLLLKTLCDDIEDFEKQTRQGTDTETNSTSHTGKGQSEISDAGEPFGGLDIETIAKDVNLKSETVQRVIERLQSVQNTEQNTGKRAASA